ncbi:MAG: hypothetical protein HXN54_08655, partial [Prevotella nigrescens]|nr:hypothetical protein [Prevotella nigrescens]
VFVVPLIAESTINVGSPDFVIKDATPFIRSGEPTDVPPNFITFIIFNLSKCGFMLSSMRLIVLFWLVNRLYWSRLFC